MANLTTCKLMFMIITSIVNISLLYESTYAQKLSEHREIQSINNQYLIQEPEFDVNREIPSGSNSIHRGISNQLHNIKIGISLIEEPNPNLSYFFKKSKYENDRKTPSGSDPIHHDALDQIHDIKVNRETPTGSNLIHNDMSNELHNIETTINSTGESDPNHPYIFQESKFQINRKAPDESDSVHYDVLDQMHDMEVKREISSGSNLIHHGMLDQLHNIKFGINLVREPYPRRPYIFQESKFKIDGETFIGADPTHNDALVHMHDIKVNRETPSGSNLIHHGVLSQPYDAETKISSTREPDLDFPYNFQELKFNIDREIPNGSNPIHNDALGQMHNIYVNREAIG